MGPPDLAEQATRPALRQATQEICRPRSPRIFIVTLPGVRDVAFEVLVLQRRSSSLRWFAIDNPGALVADSLPKVASTVPL